MVNEFGEIFRTLRKEKQLTQEQIAEILGVSPQAVSRWENVSTYPDITILPQIASYFETSIEGLLGITEVCKIQKLLNIQGMWQESFDVVNNYLEDGWIVKDIQSHSIGDGNNVQGIVLIEKLIHKKTGLNKMR